MTSKLDEELERLSKAATGVSETVDGGRWSCTIHFGEGEDARANMRAFADFVLTSRRTGQLVPAQPSVDVVEAVARKLAPFLEGGREYDQMPATRRELKIWSRNGMALINDATQDDAQEAATAAITTYEAVSGVAKMRDALKKTMTALSEAIEEERARINSMRGAVLERTTNRDLAAIAEWQSAVDAARAALGEQP